MSDTLKPGQRRTWNHNGREIEILHQRTENPYAGEWEYRNQDGNEGILEAAYLLDASSPAPTNPSGGAVTSTPAPSGDTTPALVALDRTEAETRVLKASLAWHAADGADLAALRETFWALKDAIRDYAEVAS